MPRAAVAPHSSNNGGPSHLHRHHLHHPQPDDTAYRPLLGEFNLSAFMFGSLFELTASTPTSLAPTLGHYIPPNINDDIYDFVANPLDGRMTCYWRPFHWKELFHPMASTGGSHFAMRTRRAEKREFCHTPNTGCDRQ